MKLKKAKQKKIKDLLFYFANNYIKFIKEPLSIKLLIKLIFSGSFMNFNYFFGNQPFCTLSRCLISSWIAHKNVTAITPSIADNRLFSTTKDNSNNKIPIIRNAGHSLMPKWYSLLITMIWPKPVVTKKTIPIIIP